MKARQPKKVKAEELNSYMTESRGLERDLLSEVVRSRKAAWNVSKFLGLVALGGIAAGIAGLWREAPPPLILRVDNATGAVDTVTAMRVHETSYGEVVDQYWLNQYVLNRESYDYNTIQLNYDTTALLSSPSIQQDYGKLFEGPDARDAVLANKVRIVVSIRSIQPNNRGQATVRFTTREIANNGQAPIVRNMIATIGYTYVNAPMSTQDRRINPLGFQVTSYRVDPEAVN
ncbi:virB8 family protein [Brucella cytisi]|uniref:Type IV secretion system protein virB8 n=1 Tax=Brucella cytisi TaxID=407152 RepID=A0A1J6HAW8_9HYPH|nr:type IV secretion system protein [Brucella cytisi]OIS90252.1 TrwG protein [Brucella cytisi]